MGTKRTSGFTIIEVSMVLAIAALLMVGIMAGISFAVQRQRFSDSVNSTQSYIQQQYNESQTVTINRGGDVDCQGSRGASNCLVLGKLIDLYKVSGDDYVMHTRNVIIDNADFESDTYRDRDALDTINLLHPRTKEDDSEDFLVPWGASLKQPADGSIPVRYIAILRSPRTGELNVYKLTSVSDDAPNDTSLHFVELDDKIHTCIASSELTATEASLEIDKTASQDGVTTKFDGADCS